MVATLRPRFHATVIVIVGLLGAAAAVAQDGNGLSSLGGPPTNALDIPRPEASPPPRSDEANRVLDLDASNRSLDRLRSERLDESTHRYRDTLPLRQDNRSIDARSQRRVQPLR